MISHADKRAALGLTQADIDTAARRTAVALTLEARGSYVEHVQDLLSEAMACAVFATDVPERDEWTDAAMADFRCEQFEARGEAA